MNKIKFIEWLEEVMTERGITRADLARKSGISPAHITRILSGEQSPGVDAIVMLANALNKPPEEVFRRVAGIQTINEENSQKEEIQYLYNKLPPERREMIRELAQFYLGKKDQK